MSKPHAILGTMTMGGQTSEEDAAKMVADFCSSPRWSELVAPRPMLDTAIMYQGGKTEEILGRVLSNAQSDSLRRASIATKANPFTGDKDLSPSGLRSQLQSSLSSLQRNAVETFYLHAPDARHDIEPTLEEVQKLHSEGKFKEFALSNFTAWETVYIHSYMSRREGYVVPTVYQGMYNAITRQVETDLFPALRKLGMRFYAYNPLAGGMLTGKYSPPRDEKSPTGENEKVGGRFAGKNFWAKRYRERYQQAKQFEAIEKVREALGGGSMADASLRWLRHHSMLRDGDGIIVGASKVAHYEANMVSLASGPLPDHTVAAFNKASRLSQDVCPEYARGYSGSNLSK